MNPKTLNPADLAELVRVTSLNPDVLTPEEVNILYARRGYLNKDQLSTFQSVLDQKDKDVEAAAELEANPVKEKPKK